MKETPKYDQPPRASDIHGQLAVHGEMLKLNSVINAFTGDFMICEDFISIVGGLCNHGETKGDIDILIKCPEPNQRSPLGMATKFRIARAMAKVGVDEERLQFLYDDFSGPFTSHAHLYDLVLRLKSKRELHEMSAVKSVKPFSFVTQPKPIHGRFKEEIYSPETVAKVVETTKKWKEALPTGILVERKFDGVRCQVHKVGSKVEIWTEEKTNVTDRLPTLTKEFNKIKHNFVAEFEAELWLEGKHQNRADTAAVFHAKTVHESESQIISNCYDLLWLDGKDIHSVVFSERSQKLHSTFPTTEKIKPSKTKLVKSLEELKKAVKEVSDIPGSEGAMIKLPSYVYPLTTHTSDMIKFKKEDSIKVQVVEVHHVKDSDARNYLTAIKDGQKLIPVGRTYNTKITSDVGDYLEVVFVELSKYIDPKTKEAWYNFWSPRVVDKASSADSSKTAEALVKKTGGQIAEKPFPTRYKNLLEEEEEDYINRFLSNAALWDSEEVDFAISQEWITVEHKLKQ